MHNLRYILYARKSSEDDDRQAQSIDDQVRIMTDYAARHDLKIINEYREAKSAKKPDNRPLFTQMINDLKNGKADAILCWHSNRLSRNPIDGGLISWLLQTGVIKVIQTSDRLYRPEDNVLIWSVESGMANQYIRDLSRAVSRGMAAKITNGGWPGIAPIGYMNKRDDKTIIVDPIRFPLIRKAWDMMLTGRYHAPIILKTLNNEWGFRSIKRRRVGGTPLTTSGIYKIFNNPFYKGTVTHGGNEGIGKHEPMVTIDEFDRVQQLLGDKAKYRTRKHTFSYTGLIRCGECGCLITAQEKHKTIKSTGLNRTYVYYHCTRRSMDPCTQKKVTKLEDLEAQIEAEIAKYTIPAKYRDWALKVIRENSGKKIEQYHATEQSLRSALMNTQRQMENLTQMRYRDLIDDAEYSKQRATLRDELQTVQSKIDKIAIAPIKEMKMTEKVFNFAAEAKKAFGSGSSDTKRTILMSLGQNRTLKDGKLTITPYKWLLSIEGCTKGETDQNEMLELTKKVSTSIKGEPLSEKILTW